jgi:hypothetical protein
MGKAFDLTGQRFGRWTVVKATDERRGGYICWLCRCDCGTERIRPTNHIKSCQAKSCGCIKRSRRAVITKVLNALPMLSDDELEQVQGAVIARQKWRAAHRP